MINLCNTSSCRMVRTSGIDMITCVNVYTYRLPIYQNNLAERILNGLRVIKPNK